MNNDQYSQSPHLTDYYYVLSKHKWLILSSLILITSLTTFFTFRMEPVYQASALMVIEKEKTTSPLTGERTEVESFYTQSLSFKTHSELITSRPVLQQVIKALNLDQADQQKSLEVNPFRKFKNQLKQNIRLLLAMPEKELTPLEKADLLINKIKSKITVEPIRDTHLLNINVEDHDPVLACDIANSLAK